MDEDLFNMEIRRFLKQLGVTSQRAIEKAVREGLESGALGDTDTVRVAGTITIDRLGLSHRVTADLKLG